MDEAEDSREKVKRIQVQHHDEEGWLQSGETGNMKTELIYEDREILVVYKPAGFATQTAGIGHADVVSELKNYIWQTDRKTEQTKPAGNTQPYLGVIHRLDQPVEGLLVFARNARAAAHLSRQLQRQDAEGGFCKCYYAVVCGRPPELEGRLEDYLRKRDGRAEIMELSSKEGSGWEARRACLRYRILQILDRPEIALADIRLETGRFHQIRAQMAHGGMALLGDRKYGDDKSLRIGGELDIQNAALCAYRLEFVHPVSGGKMEFQVKPGGKAFSFFSQL